MFYMVAAILMIAGIGCIIRAALMESSYESKRFTIEMYFAMAGLALIFAGLGTFTVLVFKTL